MINKDFKYVWEERRGIYRVVADTPEYRPDTKKTIHHYVTIGKAKEKNGPVEFGPKHLALQEAQKASVKEEVKAKTVIPSGEKLVMDKAVTDTGLSKALDKTLGKDLTAKVVSLAYFLLATGEALSNSEVWLQERELSPLNAARISELLPQISEEKCSLFFREWLKTKAKGKTICYDITSVSTYAKDMDLGEYGYNRDHERWLKQINLAFVTDKQTHMPLAYRVVNGSLSDVNTLKDTVREFIQYGATPYGMVMDRGFWGQERLQMLTDEGIKYMIPVPSSVSWGKKIISDNKSNVFLQPPHEDDDGSKTYGCTVYDPNGEGRHVWAHVYYSPAIETLKKEKFVEKYTKCRQDLLDGTLEESQTDFAAKYFTVSTRGRGGKRHVEEKAHLVDVLARQDFGYWVLYTDMEKDWVTALDDYRDRGFIEAGFDDLKGATDAKRLRVHYSKSVFGRIFIQFVSQILRTYLRGKAKSFDEGTQKFASSPSSILTRVRSYSKVKYSGRYKAQFTQATKGQRLIFKALGIDAEQPENDEDSTEVLLN